MDKPEFNGMLTDLRSIGLLEWEEEDAVFVISASFCASLEERALKRSSSLASKSWNHDFRVREELDSA